ncbi:hypothetical protein CRG98_025817 [Punica granatum]|uniref:G-patch domain-containing protein n=1 Tax=Punica granatum TaxID=22663 RepID=A0A2I0JC25_PUNGR|nr:hypothetical protein CRG98_025817 [Punica granatum]
MSLRAEDISSWVELAKKFVEQYQYNIETPQSFLELSTMEMAEDQKFEKYAIDWRSEVAKHFPPFARRNRYRCSTEHSKGAYYSHLMGHKSSFSEMIMAGKQIDLGIKLGRLNGQTKKVEGEYLRKTAVAATLTNSRRGNEASVNAVNLEHPGSQQYSVNFIFAPPATPAYVPPTVHYQTQHPAQPVYYSALPAPQQIVHHYSPASTQQYRPPASRVSQPTQQTPVTQGQQSGTTQSRQRIYFIPANQDQSLHCEYHSDAPGHTTDNCWKLREEVQKLINDKKISFNIIRPPNVQANPLPDHGSSSGPTINMISVYTMREDESQHEGPTPFVIEYVPAEATVGQCSGRVYKNLETTSKGKAPAASRVVLEASPIPQKKVTEKEAEAFMKVIKASEYKVPKKTGPDRIDETVSSIFSNAISFSNDELPSEGWAHSRVLHIVCKCNNFVIGRVIIDKGSALNVCPVSTLKQINVDLNRIRPSKIAVRAFDGSRREVNGEIDLLIDVGPYSFSVTFQVLDIPNAFSLLLGRPWIHLAGAVSSSLHKRIKFIAEGRLITVKGEENYVIYKETNVPYISIGDDENLPFYSFKIISVIRDYGEISPSRADRMVEKVLLLHNYIPGIGLGAHGQGINRPIEIEEYKNRRGLDFRSSCYEIIEARKGKHLHRLAAHYRKINRGSPTLPLSHFFLAPPHIVGGLDEDGRVPEIEESLRRLENRQFTSVEPTEELNVGIEEEPHILKIKTGLDPIQRGWMIEFLTEYQEAFAWSYADMPSLDPSIVKHFLPLDTKKFSPKQKHLRRQRAGLLLRIKEEVVKQINAGFLEVCNYSEWVANIVPVEKKDGRVRVCVDYRDLNKASPKDNFPLPHIDILVDNTTRHTLFSFMDGFSGHD